VINSVRASLREHARRSEMKLREDQFSAPLYLDASVAVKLLIEEEHSEKVKNYFERKVASMTVFCFHETLSVLKGKWKRKEITEKEYLNATYQFISLVQSEYIELDDDFDLTDDSVFFEIQSIVKESEIDLSDALQILSVKKGRYKSSTGYSQTILATADRGLIRSAQAFDVRVWNVLNDEPPIN
jgi:predicted nucleic acid-binding protein